MTRSNVLSPAWWLSGAARRVAVAVCLTGTGMAVVPLAWSTEATTVGDNTVRLSASASVEVLRDVLTVSLQGVREGADAAAVQGGLKQLMNESLNQARALSRSGAMEVRTGQFQLSPRYGRDGRINGWSAQAELILQGKDVDLVTQTAGALNKLNLVSVNYSVSRELREQHESALSAQAVASFRARAAELARAFGASGYQLREAQVDAVGEGGFDRPAPMAMLLRSAASAEADPLPAQAGKAVLKVQVQGSSRTLP
jgi:predicted secreted protein